MLAYDLECVQVGRRSDDVGSSNGGVVKKAAGCGGGGGSKGGIRHSSVACNAVKDLWRQREEAHSGSFAVHGYVVKLEYGADLFEAVCARRCGARPAALRD